MNTRHARSTASALAGLALTVLGSVAGADPLVTSALLPPSAQRALAAEARADRRVHPAAWERVMDLQGLNPGVYRVSRVGRPTVTRELMGLGADALLPMLDALAVSGYPRALDAVERESLTVGLLEAVGALRDRRAAGVLRAAFEASSYPDAQRAAARGMAMLGGDEEWAGLRAAAVGDGPRRVIALEALGVCERPEAWGLLLSTVRAGAGDAVVIAAARGVSERGSSWGATARGESATRADEAAGALVRAYARAGERSTANELAVAVLGMGAPSTRVHIATELRGATGVTRERLEALDRMAARSIGR